MSEKKTVYSTGRRNSTLLVQHSGRYGEQAYASVAPGTKQPLKAEDLYPIFAKAVSSGAKSDGCMDRNTGRSA